MHERSRETRREAEPTRWGQRVGVRQGHTGHTRPQMALRRLAKTGCAAVGGVAAAVAAAPSLASIDAVAEALTPDGLELSLSLGWLTSAQKVSLKHPKEGLHDVQVELQGSLVRLLRGGIVQGKLYAKARGGICRAPPAGHAAVRLELGDGKAAAVLAQPATITGEVVDTAEASLELLEPLAAVHPWLADILMAGAGTEASGSPITLDAGSRLRLWPPSAPPERAITATGSIAGRPNHPVRLQHAGGWAERLLRCLEQAGVPDTSAATVDLGEVHLATSTLKWEMREGRATFERADMLLNRTVRLASWGTCEFTGNGRRVDATIALPAATLALLPGVSSAMLAPDEGVTMRAKCTMPEPPPRGVFMRAVAEGKTPPPVETVDWMKAVDWGEFGNGMPRYHAVV